MWGLIQLAGKYLARTSSLDSTWGMPRHLVVGDETMGNALYFPFCIA